MPEGACTSDGTTCAPTERCVPDVFEPPRTFPAGTAPADLVLRDVNGDTHLDAVVVHDTGKSVLTLLGSGDGAFAAPVYSVVSGGSDLAVADFDGDGRFDVVVPSSPTSVAFGDGGGAFVRATELPIEAKFVAVADVNADEALDFVTLAFLPRTVQVHLGDGRGAFTSGEPFEVSEQGSPKSLALVDLDGDEVLDLVVGNLDVQTLSVSYGNGDGTFADAVAFATRGGDPWALSFADWNSDGRLDVATANDYVGSISVLLGASLGTFVPATVYPTGVATNSVVTEDFDRDGNLDLLAAHLNQVGIGSDGTGLDPDTFIATLFRGTGTGSFVEPRAFPVGAATLAAASSLFNLATGDVNEDGRVDVVATNLTAQNVAVLLSSPFGHCVPAP